MDGNNSSTGVSGGSGTSGGEITTRGGKKTERGGGAGRSRPGFMFINTNHPSEATSNDAIKQIRSHVAKDIHARGRRGKATASAAVARASRDSQTAGGTGVGEADGRGSDQEPDEERDVSTEQNKIPREVVLYEGYDVGEGDDAGLLGARGVLEESVGKSGGKRPSIGRSQPDLVRSELRSELEGFQQLQRLQQSNRLQYQDEEEGPRQQPHRLQHLQLHQLGFQTTAQTVGQSPAQMAEAFQAAQMRQVPVRKIVSPGMQLLREESKTAEEMWRAQGQRQQKQRQAQMQQSKQRHPRPLTRAALASQSSSLRASEMALRQEPPAVMLSFPQVPYLGAVGDPFQTSSRPLTKTEFFLVDHFVNWMIVQKDPACVVSNDISNINMLKHFWVPFALGDSEVLPSLLLQSSLNLSKMCPNRDDYQRFRWAYKNQCLRATNKSLTRRESSLSDSNIARILVLGAEEWHCDNFTAWGVHIDAVTKMIAMRGGLDTLGVGGLLKMVYCQIHGALQEYRKGGRPRYGD